MPDAPLYDLADRLYQLAPWRSMDEDQIIRVIHPATGESGYVSIMGALGTHRCLVVYLGEEALHRFNLMLDARNRRRRPQHPDAPRRPPAGHRLPDENHAVLIR